MLLGQKTIIPANSSTSSAGTVVRLTLPATSMGSDVGLMACSSSTSCCLGANWRASPSGSARRRRGLLRACSSCYSRGSRWRAARSRTSGPCSARRHGRGRCRSRRRTATRTRGGRCAAWRFLRQWTWEREQAPPPARPGHLGLSTARITSPDRAIRSGQRACRTQIVVMPLRCSGTSACRSTASSRCSATARRTTSTTALEASGWPTRAARPTSAAAIRWARSHGSSWTA